jgi:hypothetical protein
MTNDKAQMSNQAQNPNNKKSKQCSGGGYLPLTNARNVTASE